ncbi:hypothetical protein FHW19_003498 [Ochrobactrum anthropi]|uniref:hypothetical protein n=1 Tax=Brucella anthropi TaxID=529 RepID=UPI00125DB812|nr:hypothetical protein [Brucella anthropi]MBA8861771.1 hypothetical protein [Brucella anthropi]QFP65555.1 hypothetical protein FT787_21135 [Brucella anthropi]
MSSARRMKYLIVDGFVGVMCWRQPVKRFGCDRSRRILDRFPKQADAIARATVEGGSRLRAGKAVRHD